MPARVTFKRAWPSTLPRSRTGRATGGQAPSRNRRGSDSRGATLPSIRTGAAELALHRTRCARCTPRSRRSATRRRATARAPSRTCRTPRERPRCASSRTRPSRAGGGGADPQLVALAILARSGHRRPARTRAAAKAQPKARTTPRKPPVRAPERSAAPVLPPDILRGSHVGLVTSDASSCPAP